ncbi:hypothetical protein AYL99_11920 [Fonsecaea erecta]|uniref:Uncharacterized protein n=1 Tax=Fonsecaea erecta TaxID=1367422 RepID=A0A178Z269_9EURO|nr:hypothetical protein AYL99_11920 [Fonsecaea erecta]OAP53898.1 hypothetical protein AYL99_11920 [Fonsecaea erecta]
MADKYDPSAIPSTRAVPQPQPDRQASQSSPPQMAYDPNYLQQQYDASRGVNQGHYSGLGYGPPPPGWNGQPRQVIYQMDRSGDGPRYLYGNIARVGVLPLFRGIDLRIFLQMGEGRDIQLSNGHRGRYLRLSFEEFR